MVLGQAGKGSGPREHQYSKAQQKTYGIGYERVFGPDCTVCRRKGYIYDDDAIKQVCPICKGTGKG